MITEKTRLHSNFSFRFPKKNPIEIHQKQIQYHPKIDNRNFRQKYSANKNTGLHHRILICPEYETVQKDLTVLFLDLKNDESSTYSIHMANNDEGYDEKGMKENEKYFGTIALSVNRDMTPQELFTTYKERELIEDGNKAYKDVLDNFASNKHGTDTYKGWLFINHIALMLYYRVLGKIKEKGLSSKYSVEDVIDVAKRITMQNIAGEWNENVPALSDLKAYTDVFQ